MRNKNKEKIKVTILSREKITTYPQLGKAEETYIIAWQAEGLPPGLIFIPAKEYSPEKEKEMIKKAIEDLKKRKIEEIEV